MRKKNPWQHRFDLYKDDPADVKLHEKLKVLGKTNEASKWIKDGLKELARAETELEKLVANPRTPEEYKKWLARPITDVRDHRNTYDWPKEDDDPEPDEPHYVDPEEIP